MKEITDNQSMLDFISNKLKLNDEIRAVTVNSATTTDAAPSLLLDINNGRRFKITIEQVNPAAALTLDELVSPQQMVAIRAIANGFGYQACILCLLLFELPIASLRKAAASNLITALTAMQHLWHHRDDFVSVHDLHEAIKRHGSTMSKPVFAKLMRKLAGIGAVCQQENEYNFKFKPVLDAQGKGQ